MDIKVLDHWTQFKPIYPLTKGHPGVNFTNILRAAFVPKSFCPKIRNTNCKHIKAAQKNFGMTVNFTNILQAAFSNQSSLHSFNVLTICVSNFWAKGFWRKSYS
jgi:hypothetical protein